MPLIGSNTARCASAYNTSDLDRQSSLPMTDTLKEAVEKALGTTPVNDDHKQLIADVKEKCDDYISSGSTTLFDFPEWHALQTYLGGYYVGDVKVIRRYAENTLPTLNWLMEPGCLVTNEINHTYISINMQDAIII